MFQRPQILLKFSKRFASQAVQKSPTQAVAPVSKLDNGITVVSTNPNDKVSRISVLINAGSRFEDNSNRGVCHLLRAAAGLSCAENSAFMSTQLTGQLGGALSTSGTKEHIVYSLTSGSSVSEKLFADVLAPLICSNKYEWFEMDEMDIFKVMKYQKARANNDASFNLMDAAHEASFRGGLSNSLFAPDKMIESHQYPIETIMDFVGSGFNPNRIVLSGSGIDHEKLCKLASHLQFNLSDTGLSDKSSFVTSEVRQNTLNTGSVNAALCFEGVPLKDQDAIALAVLQQFIGTGSQIKRGSTINQGALNGALVKSAVMPFCASAFSANYSDTGLFGITISSQAEDGAPLLNAVSFECKSYAEGKISDKQVEVAKQKLKAQVGMNSECLDNVVEDMGVQASLLGGFASPSEICSKIDQVTPSQVVRAAKKVFGGKKSLAAIGELYDYPYLQDL